MYSPRSRSNYPQNRARGGRLSAVAGTQEDWLDEKDWEWLETGPTRAALSAESACITSQSATELTAVRYPRQDEVDKTINLITGEMTPVWVVKSSVTLTEAPKMVVTLHHTCATSRYFFENAQYPAAPGGWSVCHCRRVASAAVDHL